MSAPDDIPRDDSSAGQPLDEEAAWQAIVANYGDRPVMGEPGVDEPGVDEPGVDEPALPDPAPVDPGPFDRSYLDALDGLDRIDRLEGPERDVVDAGQVGRADDVPVEEARAARRWDEEEHFVPPPPPPIPTPTPLRRLAWLGLMCPPLLMMLAVVLGWTFPTWFSLLLVGSFVGGFLALVATMPRGGGDGWDDGAVV